MQAEKLDWNAPPTHTHDLNIWLCGR